MFVSQAHSYRQQARLAITLAWVAGCTNAIAILACGEAVSHATGHTTQLGTELAALISEKAARWNIIGFLLFTLASFLLGALLSGFASEFGRRKGWESVYVLPMSLEAVTLAGFALLLEFSLAAGPGAQVRWVTGLGSLAMGMQNATITRISNGVVRTTHVTGVLTDLGIEIGHTLVDALRPEHRSLGGFMRIATGQNARRLGVLVSVLGSFILGAGLGSLLFGWNARLALFPPVLFLAWTIYQDVARPIAEIEPSELVREGGFELPAGLVLLQLRPDHRRSGVQRLPGFETWYDRLEPMTRVVVLDFTRIERLNANSIIELRATADYLRRHGRRLILAGISQAQLHEFRRVHGGRRLDPGEVCPDLELALAQGINVLAELTGEPVRP